MHIIDRIDNLVVSNEHQQTVPTILRGKSSPQAKNLWYTPSFMMQTSRQQCATQIRNILSSLSFQELSYTFYV